MNDSHKSTDGSVDKQRLKELSHDELVKLYGRGYKLLLKAGFTAESAKTAPIKVHVRKPREGLKDDDTVGRRALGEPASTSSSRTTVSKNEIDEYIVLYPRIKRFLESKGGSCSIKTLFYECVRPEFPRSNLSIFNLVVSVENKFFQTSSGSVFLIRPPTDSSPQFECVGCHQYFPTLSAWCWHVLRTLDQMHGEYEKKLTDATAKAPGLTTYTCLACARRNTDYPNLLRLLHHCRTMNNEDHDKFGLAIIQVFLTPQVAMMDTLFLSAIEDGDSDFPYNEISSEFFETIPFEPATPIDLSSDDEVEEIYQLD